MKSLKNVTLNVLVSCCECIASQGEQVMLCHVRLLTLPLLLTSPIYPWHAALCPCWYDRKSYFTSVYYTLTRDKHT